jgi:geranylgeranyl pyrophosphate synthase
MAWTLDAYLGELRAALDHELRRVLPEVGDDDPSALRAAMRYAVLAGGKRLRPCLTIAACQAVGGTLAQAMVPACAVELVHCYSLVHDDLPAMDDDDERRGRPTCHRQYGETAAILAGDALLTLAFELMADEALRQPQRGAALSLATLELARAAGAAGMVGGQAVDISLKQTRPSFALLETCHRQKTAALFAGSVVIGGLVGGAEQRPLQQLRDYGIDLGLAFQHADDLRDAEYVDHRRLALPRAGELSRSAAKRARELGERARPLVALAEYIEQRATESESR